MSTPEEGTLTVGVVVSLFVEVESVAIKDRVLGILLLSWNEDEIGCHARSMDEGDDNGAASGYSDFLMLENMSEG